VPEYAPPDYAPPAFSISDFYSSPEYQSARAQQQLGLGKLNNAANSAIAQAIISFGDPALASQAGFGIDPQSAAFTKQNYISGNATLAWLDKQHDLARRQVINALAGRGLLFSGDTGYQEGQARPGVRKQRLWRAVIRGVRQNELEQENAYQQAFQSSIGRSVGYVRKVLAATV